MAGIGLVDEPVELVVEAGHLTLGARGAGDAPSWTCSPPTGDDGTNIAELGIGTNEKAKLTGEILEDEKILGTLPRRLRRLGRDRRQGPGAGPPRLRGDEADRRRSTASRSSATASCWSDHGAPSRGCWRVPNFSEGRSERVIGALGATLGVPCAGPQPPLGPPAQPEPSTRSLRRAPKLAEALVAATEHALDLIDMRSPSGSPPAHRRPRRRARSSGRARAAVRRPRSTAAPRAAEGIGALGVPVFLYGELASGAERRERAFFRQRRSRRAGAADGSPASWRPTSGRRSRTERPAPRWSPRAGRWSRSTSSWTLATLTIAREIAAELREAGGGLPGVRAIGLRAAGRGRSGLGQRARSVEVPLARVVAEVARAGGRARRPPGRGRSWSGWRPRPPSSATATSLPIARFRSEADVIEERLSARFRAMAQTKKKRRRKHRGTQAGRIDRKPARGRPRSRSEAQARARSKTKRSPAARVPRAAELGLGRQEGR